MEEKGCIFNIQKFSIHDGPGIRTVVFFKGCSLRCYWCSNPESQSGKPEKMWDSKKNDFTTVGEYKTINEIIIEVMKDEVFYKESGGGVTLSGGEVLYQSDFAIKLLQELKNKEIHTACETAGFAKLDTFTRFIKYIDSLYFDIKHYDSQKHMQGVKVSNEIILQNLKVAVGYHNNIIVRIPVIPGFNNSLEDAMHFAKLFKKVGVKSIELLPFHQFGEKKYEYLNRKYQMLNYPQLQKENLIEYAEVMLNNNIKCIIA